MRIIEGFAGAALLALAGCGSGAGANQAGGANRAGGAAQVDAVRERPIPCTVQAHGMSAVIQSMREQPQKAPCDNSVDPQRIALDELIRIIPDQHPSFYYILASRLFEANRGDEGVFYFYAGQLRYRIRLACHPDLPPDTEPALLASLQEEVGRPVNEYAGGDPDAWAAAIEHARDWDAATRNGYEPKAPCQAQIADQHAGMTALIAQIRANKDQIRAQRRANGLLTRR
jgi:hypothetical protein